MNSEKFPILGGVYKFIISDDSWCILEVVDVLSPEDESGFYNFMAKHLEQSESFQVGKVGQFRKKTGYRKDRYELLNFYKSKLWKTLNKM